MSAVLIIGAAGGIGEALSELLVAQGRPLIVAGRSEAKTVALASRLDQAVAVWDARDEEDWQRAMSELDANGSSFDAIVNLAGSILIKPLEKTTLLELRETLDSNLTTAFLTVKYGAPRLAQAGGGSIVLMSSVAAQFGLPHHEAIAAAKGAVEGLVRSAAASYAGKNVRINAVAPALVETPLSRRFLSSEEAKKASTQMHPIGRIGQPQDVASLLATLVAPAFSWMTGQVLSIDGGMGRIKGRR